MEIERYTDADYESWDAFSTECTNATLLTTRGFLSYHGGRFEDCSVFLKDGEKILGAFPAAVSLDDQSVVVSHPGITYGGIIHAGALRGARMIEALQQLKSYYREIGFAKLQYKVVPHIYTSRPSQDDLYALFLEGASRFRCDLSCSIDLHNRPVPGSRRKRGLKKALKFVTISTDFSNLADLHAVIVTNLEDKHDSLPVHSLDELELLASRFPEEISICCALIEGVVEAGVIFFKSSMVWHAQYIGSSAQGYKVTALDAVFDSSIRDARDAGVRYFDFGTSNEEGGRVLNAGLYGFKSEFGGSGVVHEYYQLDLK